MRGKPFSKGADPRRHTFTREECQTGFWRALEAVQDRHPFARDAAGRHITCNFMAWRQRRGRV